MEMFLGLACVFPVIMLVLCVFFSAGTTVKRVGRTGRAINKWTDNQLKD